MKTEDEVKEMLAYRGGNTPIGNDETGAVALRIRAQRAILREILELDTDQMLCVECHTVQGDDERWRSNTLCPDCFDACQTRLDEITP